MHNLLTTLSANSGASLGPNIAVSESRVILGERGVQQQVLFVFDVGSDHNVRAAGSVALKMRFQGIAFTFLDDVTLVAFSQETSLSLQRLESMRLETVYQIGLNDTN